MDIQSGEENEERFTTANKSFTEALKEKYLTCVGLEYVNVFLSPKRKHRNSTADLSHLRTIVLNNMNVITADIPNQGLMSLCPNVVDLDLTNNLLDKWSELLAILYHMPQLKFVNVSRNNLNVDSQYHDLPKTPLNIENLALNYTGITIEDMIDISQIMPTLKELHLCGNDYEHLGSIDDRIKKGAFSSLECLRLNNNKIKNWSEVWKLRHLRSLKNLIMSDNPVSNFVYNKNEEKKYSTCFKKDLKPEQDITYGNHIKNDSKGCTDLSNFNFQDFESDNLREHQINDSFGHVMDGLNYDCDSNYVEESLQYNNELDLSHNEIIRPISRIGRHDDSDVEDQEDTYYNDMENIVLDCTPGNEDYGHDVIESGHWLDMSKSSNDSFNTSSSSALTVTDEDSFMEKNAGTDNSDVDILKSNQNSCNQCQYALMAESFLYDILNSIDFMPTEATTFAVTDICSSDYPSCNTTVSWTHDHSSTDPNIKDIDTVKSPHANSLLPKRNNETMSQCCDCFNATVSPEGSPNSVKKSPDLNFENDISKNCQMTRLPDGTLFCRKCHKLIADYKYCEEKSTVDYESGVHNLNLSCNCQRLILRERDPDNLNTNLQCQFHQLSKSNIENADDSNLDSQRSTNNMNSKDESLTETKNDNSASNNLPEVIPFENLEMLCLSNALLSHWKDLIIFSSFPKLTSVKVQCNPLFSSVKPEDRRKLYIASLPNVNFLNGSEVTTTEREKAESHYLRHFMHEEDKPDMYHTLVQIHGEPVELVNIDLSAGYQEWASLDFICDGERKFSKKVHLTQQVGKLRNLISKTLSISKNCFTMHYNACSSIHPEYEREITELRCEGLPMSRLNFADGDEIHIKI